MPLALLVIGVVILVTAFRGTSKDLGALLKGDLTGENNYIRWLLAIAVIGSLAYIPGFKGPANLFLALLVIVIILAHQPKNSGGGFFDQLSAAFKKIGTAK